VNVLDLIKNRRTIQSFSSEPVSPEILRNAIEAALWAPNHKLTQPYTFLEILPDTRQKLAEVQLQIKEKKSKSPLSPIEKEATIKKFLEPATLIIAAIKKSESPAQQEEDYAAMACAIQNLSLYLWSEGIGSKWGTGGLLSSSEAYRILALSPEAYKICGLIWIGKARSVPPRPPRHSVEQVFIQK
jgi:nitroreductase